MIDPYAILGVHRNADAAAIKRAYKQKAKEHHPDRGGDSNKFAEISNAYDILKDPQKKSYFDHTGSAEPQAFNQPHSPFGFEDIFSQIFGHQRGPQRPAEARISIVIDLADSLRGGKRIIGVQTPVGSSNIEIDIPKGVAHGENIRYPKVAPGGLDLIASFRIRAHPNWKRNGTDMYTEIGVDFWKLIVGGKLSVTDILGKHYDMTIPARTNPGSVMRLGHCGVQRDGHNTGDIFVKLNAVLPKEIPDHLIQQISTLANKE